MSSKGTSILPFAFIILVVSLGIISWSFYNTYFGSKYQATVFEHSKMDTMRSEMEKGKKFLQQASIYSSHQSMLESAAHGGIILTDNEINSWICNWGSPPLFMQTRGCLEEFTKSYTNAYYSNLDTDLPIDVSKKPYKKTIYGVSPIGLSMGKYDDGNFEVILEGGKMSFFADNTKISNVLDQNERINRNRFWYLWRKFAEWASTNIYGSGMCDCTRNCAGLSCARTVANEAFKDLKRRFDGYVGCKMKCDCIYTCKGGSACGIKNPANCGIQCKKPKPDMCVPLITVDSWAPEKCHAVCGKGCSNVEATFPQQKSIFEENLELHTGEQTITQNTKASDPSTNSKSGNDVICAPIFMTNRLAAVHTFTCTDNKHLIPTGDGLKPLKFRVKAFGGYYDDDGCGCRYECMNRTDHPCPELEGLKKCPNYSNNKGFVMPFLK